MSNPWDQHPYPQLQLEQFDLMTGAPDQEQSNDVSMYHQQQQQNTLSALLSTTYPSGASPQQSVDTSHYPSLDNRTYPSMTASFTSNMGYYNRPQVYTQQSNPLSELRRSSSSEMNLINNDTGGLSPPTFVSSPEIAQSLMGGLQETTATDQFTTAFPMLYREQLGAGKRQRPNEDAGQPEAGQKPKTTGACARCKNLKVKCEFRSETDPCKRCMNGGHECIIPGRKKRRTPPKREHLLNQIRDQATQIQKLMAQLEVANKQPTPSQKATSPSNEMKTPILDSADPDQQLEDAKPDVKDWIEKARESLESFGGIIAGAGPKSFVVKEDPEESPSSEDGDDYEFAVVSDAEEEVIDDSSNNFLTLKRKPSREGTSRSRSHDRGSISSYGTPATSPRMTADDKLSTLPSEAVPLGLIANFALKKRSKRGSSNGSEEENDAGVMNENFFRASPGPDPMRGTGLRLPPHWHHPHILTRGIVTPAEAEKLFKIYFDNMNLSLSLLDPVLYTAQSTYWRSPFLFTVVCAIASRYYEERPSLHPQIMHYAQLAAGTALISGQKNVEMVHAYILLSLYPVYIRRWEDDRSWLYLGLAIRVATDLNLHHPSTAKPVNERHDREMLNRTRAWINCYNLDRSYASQYGKPTLIRNSDYIALHSESWWNSSVFNMELFDIHTCAYNAELKVMSKFKERIYSDPEHPTGLNKKVDFGRICSETDDELTQLWAVWTARFENTDLSIPQNCFRIGLLRMAYAYARLVALSFGFQHAFGKSNTDENPFLARCLRAAYDVVNTAIYDLGRPGQRIYLRHGPSSQTVFVTFATAFLIKLLQPKFSSYITPEKRVEIRDLAQKVVDHMGSPEIAIDEQHGPKLYSRFLESLLAMPMASAEPPQSPGKQPHLSIPSRRSRSRKSPLSKSQPTSPDKERIFQYPPLSPPFGDVPSPSSSTSLSPPPSYPNVPSFDSYTSVGAAAGGGFDFMNQSFDQGGPDYSINAPEFLQAPLPFDDLLQSMADPSVWDSPLPGFGWMNQLHGTDVQMKSNDALNMNMFGSSPYAD